MPGGMRLVTFSLLASRAAGSGCGSCWCIADAGSCPPEPPNASAATIAAFKAKTLSNPISLTCNPYEQASCDTVPPLENATAESVCAFRYSDDSCAGYEMRTHASAAAAAAAGAVVTHSGACAACSTAQDLAVYMSYFDMTAVGKKCGAEGVISEALGERCFKNLGMTDACARIWTCDAISDAKSCGAICLKDITTPYNLPPDCRLNDCLQCDEDAAGPKFKRFAGRTRRRTGLESSIQRNCSSVFRGATLDPCPSPASRAHR